MKILLAIVIALGMVGVGFVLPLWLTARDQKVVAEDADAGWPGEGIDFHTAVDKADVIGVGWVPPPGPIMKTSDGTPARLIDARVKWSVKGDLNHPIPALMPERAKEDAGPTTAPAPAPAHDPDPARYDSTDKIMFFTQGSGRVPLLMKMVPATPRRMRLLRDQLGMAPGTGPASGIGANHP